MKIILQTTQSDCLITCATMIINSYKCRVPVYTLLEKIENSHCGSNVLQLRETMKEYGFKVEGYKIKLNVVKNSMLPLIVYVNGNHFIVLEKMKGNKVIVIDPAIGRMSYKLMDIEKIYSGVVIEVTPIQDKKVYQKNKQNLNVSIKMLKNKRIIRILIGLFFTSIFTQIVAMSYSRMYELVNSYRNLVNWVLIVVVVLGVSSLIKGCLMKNFNIIYEEIYGNVMLNRLVNKNYKFFTIRDNGDLLYRINSRGTIKDAILVKVVPAIISALTSIVVIIMLYLKNKTMGLLLLTLSVVFVISLVLTGVKSYMYSNKYTQKIISLNTTTENIIRSIETIKVLNVPKEFIERWCKENILQTETYGSLITVQSIQEIISNIYMYLVPIIISIVGLISSGETGIKEVALLPLIYLVVQNVSTIGMAFISIYVVAPTVNKTNELLDDSFMTEKKIVTDYLNDNNILEIRNMSYYYGAKCVLKEIDLNIKRGEKIAVLGVSGSGKSTFLKILANLLCDYKGSVTFDNHCIDRPVYLDQDTCIIDGTIYENVAFGQDVDFSKLKEIASITGLDKIIEQQPLEWNTKISKGKSLSKGQEQRICLTRCLLKESNIYLLDEATSNIDVIDEEMILKNLFGEYSNVAEKNIFISTHKLNIIHFVDKIIFVSNGQIDVGEHKELMERNVYYKKIIEHESL